MSVTIEKVRQELFALWRQAKLRGDKRPPRVRVTLSREGWMELLSDPEIRLYWMPSGPKNALSAVLGAEIDIDHTLGRSDAERLRVELLTGDTER